MEIGCGGCHAVPKAQEAKAEFEKARQSVRGKIEALRLLLDGSKCAAPLNVISGSLDEVVGPIGHLADAVTRLAGLLCEEA